jgi:alpha-ketoglutarate-dependent taurine dioxygenase
MPRKVVQPILVESFSSLINNLPQHIDLFKKEAIVVFRGLRFSREEQLIVTRIFGDSIGWYPNTTSNLEQYSSYEENHSQTMNKFDKHNVAKDELFLPWHLEHMGHKNPAIGATWNMEKFTCDYGIGNTLFTNISDIYDLFDDEETSFFKKCKIAAFYGWAADEKGNQKEPVIHDAVQFYEPSGRMALRLNALFKYDRETFYLHSFDDREPSDEENSRFMELSLRFTENLQNNEELQYVHMWQENDLVVVDLFLMAHAVFGGFKASERFFHGYWAHRNTGSKYD